MIPFRIQSGIPSGRFAASFAHVPRTGDGQTMYENFFELSGRPFPSTPNTDAYYPSASHEEAITLLKCGLSDGEALGLLVGGPGAGKTLLCHKLIEVLNPADSLVFLGGLNDPSIEALLLAILHDLSLPVSSHGEQRLRITLMDYLMDRFTQGGKTILFVDEAQNLGPQQLEELRLLSNLEGRTHKAVQILLVGQERLTETLDDEKLAGLRQRISIHARLHPLADEEVAEYVRAHVSRVGGSADSMFTASALSEICEYSGGIPRRINQIGHRALTLAFAHESGTIDAEFIHMAAVQLGWSKSFARVEHHHFVAASAPRRIFTDLAFQGDLAKTGPAPTEPAPVGPPLATVLEVGAEDPWPKSHAIPTPPSSAEGTQESTRADVAESASDSPRFRPVFERKL